MRSFSALACVAFSLPLSFGGEPQPQAIPSPVSIVRHSWYRDSGVLRDASVIEIMPRPDAPLPPPPSVPTTSADQRNPRYNEPRIPYYAGEFSDQPGMARDVFRFRVLLRNHSKQSIRRVFWSYVFFNPKTGAVLSRQRFASDTGIKPGKSKTLEGTTRTPPSAVASVSSMNGRSRDSERIEIYQIQFADGTQWPLLK
jgi:hypothetical protein